LASTQVYFGPGDSLYAYSSADGDLMLCLVNTGAGDFGCTQIQVDRIGASAQALRPAHTPPQYVTDKTFQVIPTNDILSPYHITLYYTNAEVSGYQTATGLSWTTGPYVVKTDGSIASEYSVPVPTYVLSSTRAVGNYGTTGRWIWGQFNTFSGFAAGAPPLPLAYRGPEAGGRSSSPDRFWATSPFSQVIESHAPEGFYAFRLRTLTGEVVWEKVGPYESGNSVVLIPSLPAGLYLLEWVSAEGHPIAHQRVLCLP
jgi:hypothetical protein